MLQVLPSEQRGSIGVKPQFASQSRGSLSTANARLELVIDLGLIDIPTTTFINVHSNGTPIVEVLPSESLAGRFKLPFGEAPNLNFAFDFNAVAPGVAILGIGTTQNNSTSPVEVGLSRIGR